MKKIFTLSALTVAVLLTGCASTMTAEKNVKASNDESNKILDGAVSKITVAAQDPTRDPKSNFAKVRKNWVNPNPLPRYDIESEKEKLPAFFQDRVVTTAPGKVSLVEVLSELQRAKKIRFSINQDVYNAAGGTGTIIAGSAPVATATPSTTVPTGVAQSSVGTNGVLPVYINDFVFAGTLEQALDLMSSKANIAWKWNGSSIDIYRFETKTYSINALAGKTTTNSNVSISGNSTAGQGGAGAQTSTNASAVIRTSDIATWDDVKAYLMTLTSKDGKIAVMESTGSITVKDTPNIQDVVARAIKELNENLGKQVFMDVDIYAVTLNDSDSYGFNWNLAWGQAASKYGITLNNGSSTTATSPVSIGTTINQGPFAGTSATLKALSSIGQVSVVNQFTVSTLNGQTTPIGNNQKIDFVKSVTVTVTPGTPPITQTTVNTDSVYQGITMAVTPKVQKDSDKILLEYALTLNTVDSLSNVYTDASGNKSTLPVTTIKNILQRSSLRSGQTLVLSGFKQRTSTIANDGLGSAQFQILGGDRNSSNATQYLVITVTPHVAQE